MGLYITFIFAVHSRDVPVLCCYRSSVTVFFPGEIHGDVCRGYIILYMNLVIVLGRKINRFVLKATILSWSESSSK